MISLPEKKREKTQDEVLHIKEGPFRPSLYPREKQKPQGIRRHFRDEQKWKSPYWAHAGWKVWKHDQHSLLLACQSSTQDLRQSSWLGVRKPGFFLLVICDLRQIIFLSFLACHVASSVCPSCQDGCKVPKDGVCVDILSKCCYFYMLLIPETSCEFSYWT